MKPHYDTIVIGAGIGGTAAGAVLARAGRRVLLLEKNPRIGGACSCYQKDGVRVDVGAHMFSRCNRGPIGEVQRRLGAARLLEFRRCDPLFRIHGPGFDVTGHFRVRTLPAMLGSLFRQIGPPVREFLPLGARMLGCVALPDARIRSLDARSMEDFLLAHTRDPAFVLLMSILMGLYFVIPYGWASAGEALWCTKRAFLARDVGYPRDGAIAVPRAFAAGAVASGAELRTDTRVRHIRVREGRVAGVETDGGAFFEAGTVISTASVQDTLRLAGATPGVRAPGAPRPVRGSLSAVQAKILLDRPVVREGILVGIHDRRPAAGSPLVLEDARKMWADTVEGRVPELFSFYCPVPTNFDSTLATSGRQLLTLTAPAPRADRTPADGQQAWSDALLDACFSLHPETRKHVLWIDRLGTRFLESWLGKTGGPVISSCQDTHQTGRNRPGHATPVHGLYLAGDCAGGRGIGTELACRSGLDCADALLRPPPGRGPAPAG